MRGRRAFCEGCLGRATWRLIRLLKRVSLLVVSEKERIDYVWCHHLARMTSSFHPNSSRLTPSLPSGMVVVLTSGTIHSSSQVY